MKVLKMYYKRSDNFRFVRREKTAKISVLKRR